MVLDKRTLCKILTDDDLDKFLGHVRKQKRKKLNKNNYNKYLVNAMNKNNYAMNQNSYKIIECLLHKFKLKIKITKEYHDQLRTIIFKCHDMKLLLIILKSNLFKFSQHEFMTFIEKNNSSSLMLMIHHNSFLNFTENIIDRIYKQAAKMNHTEIYRCLHRDFTVTDDTITQTINIIGMNYDYICFGLKVLACRDPKLEFVKEYFKHSVINDTVFVSVLYRMYKIICPLLKCNMIGIFELLCFGKSLKNIMTCYLDHGITINTICMTNAIKSGTVETLSWLFANMKNSKLILMYKKETFFNEACNCNNIDVARWIYYNMHGNINFKFCNYRTFALSSITGKIDVMKLIYELDPDMDIKVSNHCAFKNSCKFDYIEQAEWLQSLYPEYWFVVGSNYFGNDTITKYGISRMMERFILAYKNNDNIKYLNNVKNLHVDTKKLKDNIKCPICLDTSDIMIGLCDKNHGYCFSCIEEIHQDMGINGCLICCRDDIETVTLYRLHNSISL